MQQPQSYGRRRSNTAQSSILRPPPLPILPLKFGDTAILNTWVHDAKESPSAILNHIYWPGVAEGDLLSVSPGIESSAEAFIFVVPPDDPSLKPQLQISVPKPIAETFGLRNNSEVTVTKVDKDKYAADYVEFSFQDQYLGRNDMWRFGKYLVDQCIYAGQELSFIGTIAAKIESINTRGEMVPAALVTSKTKVIYCSLSAKVTIFIQVCQELWEFAGDGERYNEKVVHSFLPALFSKWKEAGANHTVSIVLISRVFYEDVDIEYAAGPLRRDERGKWFKDFFKVITDLEVIHENWKPTLFSLKTSFWDFQRDILLTHHYHRGKADQVRLVGSLSYAHDGPILEALNLNLSPTETHYIDRSLANTGATTILITPGTGHFRVSKQLLRLTTSRMLDQGIGLNLISLTKEPLHGSPIFSFLSNEPDPARSENGLRSMDPLWGCDDDGKGEKSVFWWTPFWIIMSFWDEQVDLPFRQDRFIARAKMHEIQMLGLLDHDVLAFIHVPFLDRRLENRLDAFPTKEDADAFDLDIFALKDESKSLVVLTKSGSEDNGKNAGSKRTSQRSPVTTSIRTIQESPRNTGRGFPDKARSPSVAKTSLALSSSPTQSSRSIRSSTSSMRRIQLDDIGQTRSTLASRLTPSWLFKQFRSGPVEPQVTPESASASSTSLSNPSSVSSSTSALNASLSSPLRSPASSLLMPSKVTKAPFTAANTTSTVAAPLAIKRTSSRGGTSRFVDDDPLLRGALWRRSPMNTPPREETAFSTKRRSIVGSLSAIPFSLSSSSSPGSRPNPSQRATLSDPQNALAARWEHMFPALPSKHNIKWHSIVTPPCLPLTVEHFPSRAELETLYDVFSYDFVVDPPEMRSFLVIPPASDVKNSADPERRRAWALTVMRGMAAVRLSQGFQFVIQPQKGRPETRIPLRRTQSYPEEAFPQGAAEALQNVSSVWLSMSHEIHRISYAFETIQVLRYVRRQLFATQPFDYECLMWPKLGEGYTEHKTSFTPHGLDNYNWNRLDMLVAGYEQTLHESLRYWRTRFLVIPTPDPPALKIGPSGEALNEEEVRILGMDKLAEAFTKLRWHFPEEKEKSIVTLPATRFLPTTLSPAMSVLEETLMEQLDQIHAASLKKKMKSEKEISDMPLNQIAKLMQEDGLIKQNHWHKNHYPDSFTGAEFVSFLVREFRDVSSRTIATEWGSKLQEKGLFEHVRGQHNFLDGHYFYRLSGEFAISSTPTPRSRWFRTRTDDVVPRGHYPGNSARVSNASPRRNKKRLILSSSMVIDIDPNKRSDQAETVLLHHDVIHNPGNVFHFELQWVGTTPRYIEDQLRQWSRTIEKYGLKLVEGYVAQIADIRSRNAFQSCFPIRLSIAPPILAGTPVPHGSPATRYFEYALLRHFGFILDVEAADLYPVSVDVVYSYRRSPFKFSQFVHRSGVAFVQVLGGSQGFLFLTNRLMNLTRMGKTKEQRTAAELAEKIRTDLNDFCSNRRTLENFFDEELAKMGHLPDEPPPLII